ncbi:LPXTG cell wall anchor domain-containing protein [Streptococcus caprae]|uniref:LPXTG cell wall anchor domain-containing protein n=1 Tax=Streptococcus caprae TaxID=1640501 RepID=A0ABV8CX01_9STRE
MNKRKVYGFLASVTLATAGLGVQAIVSPTYIVSADTANFPSTIASATVTKEVFPNGSLSSYRYHITGQADTSKWGTQGNIGRNATVYLTYLDETGARKTLGTAPVSADGRFDFYNLTLVNSSLIEIEYGNEKGTYVLSGASAIDFSASEGLSVNVSPLSNTRLSVTGNLINAADSTTAFSIEAYDQAGNQVGLGGSASIYSHSEDLTAYTGGTVTFSEGIPSGIYKIVVKGVSYSTNRTFYGEKWVTLPSGEAQTTTAPTTTVVPITTTVAPTTTEPTTTTTKSTVLDTTTVPATNTTTEAPTTTTTVSTTEPSTTTTSNQIGSSDPNRKVYVSKTGLTKTKVYFYYEEHIGNDNRETNQVMTEVEAIRMGLKHANSEAEEPSTAAALAIVAKDSTTSTTITTSSNKGTGSPKPSANPTTTSSTTNKKSLPKTGDQASFVTLMGGFIVLLGIAAGLRKRQ